MTAGFQEHFDVLVDHIVTLERMRFTVQATRINADPERPNWQPKYIDVNYGTSKEARNEAATLVAKKVSAPCNYA